LALSHAQYVPTGDAVSGYEIHIGKTTGKDCARGWLTIDGRGEGAASSNGQVMGCYLHGLFRENAFRAAYLGRLGKTVEAHNYDQGVEDTLDDVAAHLETHLDIDGLLALAG